MNWGKQFEHFFEVAEKLSNDEDFTEEVYSSYPKFYSETKFANHCVQVYKQFRKDYPALFVTLEETQMEGLQGDSRSRKTGLEASDLLNKINNKNFALTLSGICDIYEAFSHGINVLQIVNLLPHERVDKFSSLH